MLLIGGVVFVGGFSVVGDFGIGRNGCQWTGVVVLLARDA